MPITNPSTPDSLSWSRHPINFTFNSDAVADLIEIEVEVMIVAGSDLSAGKLRATADANGDATFNVAGMVNAQLSYAAPNLNALVSQVPDVSCQYYLVVSEYLDSDAVANSSIQSGSDFYAIKGAQNLKLLQTMYLPIDEASDYVLLIGKPEERRLFTWQEETFSLLFTGPQVDATLETIIYYTDNTDHTVIDVLGTYAKADVISISASFRYRDFDQYQPAKTISRIELSLQGLDGATLIYQVSLNAISPDSRSYIFINKMGGYSVLAATGQQAISDKTSGQIYTTDYGTTGIVSQPTVDVVEQSSGFFSKAEIEGYAQMRDLNHAWLHLKGGQLSAITIVPGTTDRDRDGRNLNAFTFKYSFGSGRQDFQIINAIEFTQGGGLNVPIGMNDVTGLPAALAALIARVDLAPVDLGTNPNSWDWASKEVRVGYSVITANVTITPGSTANIRNIGLWLDVTNTVAIIFPGFKFVGSLPADVTWDDATTTLTIANASNTLYQILGEKSPLNGLITCNIQPV